MVKSKQTHHLSSDGIFNTYFTLSNRDSSSEEAVLIANNWFSNEDDLIAVWCKSCSHVHLSRGDWKEWK